ncbi:MAG: hypothetical protein AB1742_15395, partial [bacterium]
MRDMDPESVIRQSEDFVREAGMESYRVFAGLKGEAEFSAIYDRHGALFTRGTLENFRKSVLNEPVKREMIAFLAVHVVENAVREDTDRYLSTEMSATVDFEGRRYPLRQVPVAIANEPDRRRRAGLDGARQAMAQRLNPLLAKVFDGSRRVVGELGYASYAAFFEDVEGIPLDTLARQSRDFLSATKSVYEERLARACRELLNVPPGTATKEDMAYLRRGRWFDALFPAGALLDCAWRTLETMGIPAKDNPRIRLDAAPRELKSARAFCAPVRVPHEVYLVVNPHGGVEDWGAFLHELGHALHHAFTAPGIHFTARHLGDNSITEAWAMLIEHLLLNERWLRDAAGVNDPEKYLDHQRLVELYLLRRYCGKLLYELELHGGAPQNRRA